jgi:hypothetical protein
MAPRVDRVATDETMPTHADVVIIGHLVLLPSLRDPEGARLDLGALRHGVKSACADQHLVSGCGKQKHKAASIRAVRAGLKRKHNARYNPQFLVRYFFDFPNTSKNLS